MTRILFYDLECTNLKADFGRILTFGYKFSDEKKVKTIDIFDSPKFNKDPTDDKEVVKEIIKIFDKADILCGWYSSRFDLPFINSRILFHKLKPLPRMPHLDLWKTSRYELALHSNRLQSFSDFTGLGQKTALSGPIWVRASAGHKPSLKYISKHCIKDVEILEKAYYKLRPLIRGHPDLNQRGDCPFCNEPALTKRGFLITVKNKYQRFQCQNCGSWSRGERVKNE